MNECSFERLLQFLEKRLGTDAELKLFDHLHRCDVCRETVYDIARDRDEALRTLLPLDDKKSSVILTDTGTKVAVVAKFSRARRSSPRPAATGTLG